MGRAEGAGHGAKPMHGARLVWGDLDINTNKPPSPWCCTGPIDGTLQIQRPRQWSEMAADLAIGRFLC